jgi:hypothetical protein
MCWRECGAKCSAPPAGKKPKNPSPRTISRIRYDRGYRPQTCIPEQTPLYSRTFLFVPLLVLALSACGALPSTPDAASLDLTRAVIPTVLPLPTATEETPLMLPTISRGTPAPTVVVEPTIVVGDCEIPGGLERYVVQRGDRLSRIADTYNVEIDALADLNCIANPNSIFVGQTLYIPAEGDS